MRKFVAVMDSGIGGITTLTEIIGAVKGYDFVYFADKKFAPYGDKSDREIQLRVKRLAGDFFEMGASALVIACNTATNVCIDCLRKEFSNKIIVGTEPAIKLASACGGKIALLVTPLTARQKKFKSLVQKYAKNCHIYTMSDLAMLIENNVKNLERVHEYIDQRLNFLRHYDSVVLGCTHYVFLRPFLHVKFPYLRVFDGNHGVAKRLESLLQNNSFEQAKIATTIRFLSDERNFFK
ncbi:MAG: hypothetical protein E7353_10060 [Clostridiales bacterium]|nr:hypothetical protein [Clostridiales bacterium]